MTTSKHEWPRLNPSGRPQKGTALQTLPGEAPERRSPLMVRLIAGLLVALILGLIVAVGGAMAWQRSDRIAPGVVIMGMELGGHTTAEAATAVASAWRQRTTRVTAGAQSWDIPLADLGFVIEAGEVATAAHQQGRSVETLRALWEADGRLVLTPRLRFDPAIAETTLQGLAPSVEIAPTDAALRVNGLDVEQVAAVPGQRLDVPASLANLTASAQEVVKGAPLALAVVPVAPTLGDVNAAAAHAREILATTITVEAYDPIRDETEQWAVEGQGWADWITIAWDPTTPDRVQWGVRPEGVRAFLETRNSVLAPARYLHPDIELPRLLEAATSQAPTIRLRLRHRPQQHTVAEGETLSSIGWDYGIPYEWIAAANEAGDSLQVGQLLTIPSPDDLLPLPIVEHKRIVVSISEQRLWAYENGALQWEWTISTGLPDSPTSPGVFQVQSHDENAYGGQWELWMPYFMGIYHPSPNGAVMNGFHGFPTRDGSQLLWTGDLGHPITYGCVLLSTKNAATLFNWAEEGVIVEIQR